MPRRRTQAELLRGMRVRRNNTASGDQPAGVAGPGSAGMVAAGLGVVVPRSGRSSIAAMATKDNPRQMAAVANTQRNMAARSMPWAAAKALNEAAPRSGTAPSQARMMAPMIATTSALPSERKKFMAPMATPT